MPALAPAKQIPRTLLGSTSVKSPAPETNTKAKSKTFQAIIYEEWKATAKEQLEEIRMLVYGTKDM